MGKTAIGSRGCRFGRETFCPKNWLFPAIPDPVPSTRRRESSKSDYLAPLNRLIFPHFVASLCDASATCPRVFSTFRHESQATSKLLRRNSLEKNDPPHRGVSLLCVAKYLALLLAG